MPISKDHDDMEFKMQTCETYASLFLSYKCYTYDMLIVDILFCTILP